MKIRAMLLAITAATIAQFAGAANTPPLSDSWSIAASGTASSSGELLFRMTPGDGGDATEITVSVASGTDEAGVAGNIRRALNTQLRGSRFNAEAGVGANVLLKTTGKTGFSLELVDSDVENIRVAVQSAEPGAPPTVPRQAVPANPPAKTPATPPAPGDAVPPQQQPSLPVPQQSSEQPPSQPVPQQPSQPAPSQPPPQSSQLVPGEAAIDGTPRLAASALLPAPRFRYRFP